MRRFLALGLMCVALAACGAGPEAPRPPAIAADLGAAQVHPGQVYAVRDTGPLQADVYLPEPGARPSPLVVFVHGGGWDAGSRTLGTDITVAESAAAQRLLRNGYAVATVDYRLSGVARYPAQVVDVAEAVRWLQARASGWSIDPGRVVLWGSSAGGHLATQLGVLTGAPTAPGGGLTGIRGVVDWFGPVDMSAAAQVRHSSLSEDTKRVVGRLLGCMPVDCPAVADGASPVRLISGDEPPTLIQHGVQDKVVPVEQSLDFAAALRAHGVPVRMHPYQGVGHGFGPSAPIDGIASTMLHFVESATR